MIDQTTLGHQFLLNEFDVIPQTGWQIDLFGHSTTQAALLSNEIGFKGPFFARIDAAVAQTVTIDISQVFKRNLISFKEVSLTANQPIENIRKMQKQLQKNITETMHNEVQCGSINGTLITITPMEIRTFIIVLQ